MVDQSKDQNLGQPAENADSLGSNTGGPRAVTGGGDPRSQALESPDEAQREVEVADTLRGSRKQRAEAKKKLAARRKPSAPRRTAARRAPAPKAAAKSEAPKVASESKRSWVILDDNDDIPPTGLFVSHNGNPYLLTTGEPIHVPDHILEILDNAVTSAPITDERTKRVVGTRERPRYSYRRVAAPRDAA
jgi:hypothetical protein